MKTETTIEEAPRVLRKPMPALYFGDDDSISIFSAYLEFILYWTKTDAESYRNAISMVRGREERGLLFSMVAKKEEMLGTFFAYRASGRSDWFGSAFGTVSRSSAGGFMLDNGFQPIRSLRDAFHFAYRREYRSLNAFERVRRSDLETATQVLLDNAVELQRQHILTLDDRLSSVKTPEEAEPNVTGAERTGERWALVRA